MDTGSVLWMLKAWCFSIRASASTCSAGQHLIGLCLYELPVISDLNWTDLVCCVNAKLHWVVIMNYYNFGEHLFLTPHPSRLFLMKWKRFDNIDTWNPFSYLFVIYKSTNKQTSKQQQQQVTFASTRRDKHQHMRWLFRLLYQTDGGPIRLVKPASNRRH